MTRISQNKKSIVKSNNFMSKILLNVMAFRNQYQTISFFNKIHPIGANT